MASATALVLLDAKANRHSINALLGALDAAGDLDAVELRLAAQETEFRRHLDELHAAHARTLAAVSLNTAQVPAVRDLLRRLRPQSPQAVWMAGGPHPTADPAGTLAMGFDLAICGEGEQVLLDVLRALAAGDDPAAVPGVASLGPDGRLPANRRWPEGPVDLDAFPPFPRRRVQRLGPIEITRGCPFACGYCQTPRLLGHRPRHRGVEAITRAAAMIRQASRGDVRVITPNAFSYGSPDGRSLNLGAVEALLASLRRTLGAEGRLFFGTFPAEVRPEFVNEATLGLVRRYADNESLVIGAQSGSQAVLDRCGRGHTVDDVVRAVSLTAATGLKPLVDFIFGLPGETEQETAETLDLIARLIAQGAVIHAHAFMPLPRTALAGLLPSPIAPKVKRVLAELAGQRRLFGQWQRQELLARRLGDELSCGAR